VDITKVIRFLDSWLTRAINGIINAFLERVFWGPNGFFIVFLEERTRKRSQNVTRFWPLTRHARREINHGGGATLFVVAGANKTWIKNTFC
jgi:hypothetical protein